MDDVAALQAAAEAAEREAIAQAKALAKQQRADAKAWQKAAGKKVDSRLTAMARELRDRWAERANDVVAPPARHDVRRSIESSAMPMRSALPTVSGPLALPSAA